MLTIFTSDRGLVSRMFKVLHLIARIKNDLIKYGKYFIPLHKEDK
jgi:hypothetical protein